MKNRIFTWESQKSTIKAKLNKRLLKIQKKDPKIEKNPRVKHVGFSNGIN
jgi:hypothetical protein